MENSIKKIFSLKVAVELRDLGNFQMFEQENTERQGFKVFCFAKTQQLLNDLTKITNRNKRTI
ncbi:hypothetical protein LL033_11880 [Clostridium estertheticum]|uniref:hypothetical protein n=1 Tax=Clostridium estertheticum TaxID=238834 RepID=UPI001C0D14CB|nr:hypothetical protein [Clostridium estertheticum]MBU3215851.1 hypothetical protein [Clostridium estertheticum]WAG57806.1 hypothetical protein LL033_11880 [Clostridium estertheticum]